MGLQGVQRQEDPSIRAQSAQHESEAAKSMHCKYTQDFDGVENPRKKTLSYTVKMQALRVVIPASLF